MAEDQNVGKSTEQQGTGSTEVHKAGKQGSTTEQTEGCSSCEEAIQQLLAALTIACSQNTCDQQELKHLEKLIGSPGATTIDRQTLDFIVQFCWKLGAGSAREGVCESLRSVYLMCASTGQDPYSDVRKALPPLEHAAKCVCDELKNGCAVLCPGIAQDLEKHFQVVQDHIRELRTQLNRPSCTETDSPTVRKIVKSVDAIRNGLSTAFCEFETAKPFVSQAVAATLNTHLSDAARYMIQLHNAVLNLKPGSFNALTEIRERVAAMRIHAVAVADLISAHESDGCGKSVPQLREKARQLLGQVDHATGLAAELQSHHGRAPEILEKLHKCMGEIARLTEDLSRCGGEVSNLSGVVAGIYPHLVLIIRPLRLAMTSEYTEFAPRHAEFQTADPTGTGFLLTFPPDALEPGSNAYIQVYRPNESQPWKVLTPNPQTGEAYLAANEGEEFRFVALLNEFPIQEFTLRAS